ncbi:MAG: anti-sigma factor [Actinomycetota bacterium]|nr:anti-sigma factor [Actinomycetota bacterium]
MARRMTHAQIEELLGAYALDAVEDDDAAVVEAHLPECPRCTWEVASHREVAAALAHGGSPAPEGLWDRIAQTLEDAPPALDLARLAPRSAPGGRVGGRAVALMAAAALVTAVLGVGVVRQDQRVDRLTVVMRQRALEQAAASANADARAQRVTLRSEDGVLYVQTAVQDNGSGYLVRHNLPSLPEGRSYQLWGKTGASNVSLGVLGPKPGVAAFTVHGNVTAVAVTEEAIGGAVVPSGRPVVQGFL